MPTTSEGVYNINDGQTQGYTAPDDISIDSAQCRWKGQTIQKTKTDVITHHFEDVGYGSGGPEEFSGNYDIPSAPGGYRFRKVKFGWINVEQAGDMNVELEWTMWDDQTTDTNVETFPDEDGVYVGNDDDEADLLGPDVDRDHVVRSAGYDWPATPDSFDEYDSVTFGVENWTSNIQFTGDLRMEIVWETPPLKTKDPSVNVNSGSGSASISGTLDDGVWSSWQSLPGMTDGDNTFDHSISESEQAGWEFEYTFTWLLPTAEGYKHMEGPSGTVRVRLAVPGDADLHWDGRRIAVDYDGDGTVEVLALDVVDPSNSEAGPIRFEGPNQTWAYRDDPTV